MSGAVPARTIPSPAGPVPLRHFVRVPEVGGDLLDARFRALISEEDWACLSPAVRRRFGKRLAQGASAVYVGRVVAVRFSPLGWLTAQAARLVGGPLPLDTAPGRASIVAVTEDPDCGGQIWTRLYARASGFPQVIHSAKRFAGPTGLEEHVGAGVGMTLTVSVADGALTFRSGRYFVERFGRRLHLPGWLTPGALTVTHAEAGTGEPSGAFRFTLDIRHPWLGRLIRQEAIFRDAEPADFGGAEDLTTDRRTMA
ncbi:DUF4166 domain-containing protein [Methylobacterium planeticum]|uniref:DUF4166 domain-containing protein n=1 Tax=Methylobacterium planeticum TaxID=2615211 RepID=A0A6N6MQJ4_9HYPH|nr:DUF4166 domain-containing protein [Methylobacterium planeticum]KAB1072344.1 DUF4166 domain-containing protein [Methylobacterium planeticum]